MWPRNVWNIGTVSGCVIVETNEGTDGNGATISKWLASGYNQYKSLHGTVDASNRALQADITSFFTGSATTTRKIMLPFRSAPYWDGTTTTTADRMILWTRETSNPGLTPDRIQTCGYNGWGELGTGVMANTVTPTSISLGGSTTYSLTSFCCLGGGVPSVYALLASGSLYAWGRNLEGQLGDSTVVNKVSPTLVATSIAEVAFSGVACGQAANIRQPYMNACYLRTSTGIWRATGKNTTGLLGVGGVTDATAPTNMRIKLGQTFAKYAIIQYSGNGSQSQVWVGTDGDLYCWGSNSDKAILGETSDPALYPVRVKWLEKSV